MAPWFRVAVSRLGTADGGRCQRRVQRPLRVWPGRGLDGRGASVQFSVGAGALVAWCGEIRDEVIKRCASGAGELCIEQRPRVIRGLLRPATVVVQQDERDVVPVLRRSTGPSRSRLGKE